MKQIVSLSGGRDSTAMLLMMLEKGEWIDDIVFFDWGKEYPEMYEHLDKLERYVGIPFTRLYPEHPWEYWRDEYVISKGIHKGEKGYGFRDKPPFRYYRWCTRIKGQTLKRAYPVKEYVHCIGYAFEEKRRAKYIKGQRYPLLEWGVCSEEAYKYCKAHGFDWGGLYEIWTRVSCSCCPFRRKVNANQSVS